MERLNVWDELLKSAGENIEEIGSSVKDKRTDLSIEELEDFADRLKALAVVLDDRIRSLKKG